MRVAPASIAWRMAASWGADDLGEGAGSPVDTGSTRLDGATDRGFLRGRDLHEAAGRLVDAAARSRWPGGIAGLALAGDLGKGARRLIDTGRTRFDRRANAGFALADVPARSCVVRLTRSAVWR